MAPNQFIIYLFVVGSFVLRLISGFRWRTLLGICVDPGIYTVIHYVCDSDVEFCSAPNNSIYFFFSLEASLRDVFMCSSLGM